MIVIKFLGEGVLTDDFDLSVFIYAHILRPNITYFLVTTVELIPDIG